MPVYLSPQPRGPVARVIASLVGVLVLIGAFMIGMVAFLVMLGAGLLAGAWLWFRNWRLRRGPARHGAAGAGGPGVGARADAPAGDVIEGEYSVVQGDEDRSA